MATSTPTVEMDCIQSAVEPVEFYLGLPVNTNRLVKMFSELVKQKEKEKGRTRNLITCKVCLNFEDAARKGMLPVPCHMVQVLEYARRVSWVQNV